MNKIKTVGKFCLALGITVCSTYPAEAAVSSSISPPTVQQDTAVKKQEIQKVTVITKVYGDGEKPAAVAIEYPKVLAAGSVSKQDFSVNGQCISAVYTNDKPELTTVNKPGRYVIACFTETNTVSDQALPAKKTATEENHGKQGNDAPRYSNRKMPAFSLQVKQMQPVKAMDGSVFVSTQTALQSTSQIENDIAGFKQYVYTDPKTGYTIPYQLYLPKDYNSAKKYPLLFFVADASANTENAKMVLVQGNGATVWATPSEQAKHECIILAPAYTRELVDSLDMLTTDSNTWTKGLTLVSDLLFDVINRYAVDPDRIYGTGQSQGGMTNIAISDKYPELFAAQYLVACQWNVKEMDALKDKHLWIAVCEGDTKAYPGMNEATARWERLGSKVARSTPWNSKATAAEFAALVKQTEAQQAKINYTIFQGGNHMYTWSFAYTIEGIRDWLFAQRKSSSTKINEKNPGAREALQNGIAYYNGTGVKKDYEKAVTYFQEADQKGDMKAARYLGLCYEHGYGVPQDDCQAAAWYQKAMERGDITGTFYLGHMYELGKGVLQNYAKAMQYYLKSAERGDVIAAPGMVAAGRLYENGLGIKKNLVIAKQYYQQAVDAGYTAATEDLKRLS